MSPLPTRGVCSFRDGIVPLIRPKLYKDEGSAARRDLLEKVGGNWMKMIKRFELGFLPSFFL